MADQRGRGISWTDQTWNPIRGCRRVSRGCENCYAEKIAARFSGPSQPYHGLTNNNGRWNGSLMKVPDKLDEPLRWQRPRNVFVNSMSDLFFEDLDFGYIAAVFAVMASSPRHTFQVLTKRSKRALEFFGWLENEVVERKSNTSNVLSHFAKENGITHKNIQATDLVSWPLPNAWIGVSIEDQKTADERVVALLEIPAAVRWVSYEPALGPVDLSGYIPQTCCGGLSAQCGCMGQPINWPPYIDWIVVGGESGPGARPFHTGWARKVVVDFMRSGVPVFVKQLGSNPLESEVAMTLKDRKGGDMFEWPEDIRVRDWPRQSS